jgi:hypothetical protein
MSTTTTDRAQEAASTAADEGKHVASVAKEEVAHVATEAKEQARGVLDDAMTQINEQSQVQRDRLVETLRSLSGDLQKMAEQSGATSLATDVARQVADRTRELSSRLDGRDPSEILDDVRDFARRKPGVFLLGALVAGVAVGRLARGAKESPGASTQQRGSSEPTGTPTSSPGYGVSTPGYRTQDAPTDADAMPGGGVS